MASYLDLLNAPIEDITKPALVPNGTYHGQIIKHSFDKSREKQTDFCRLAVKLLAPTEDVDQELASERADRIVKFEGHKDFFITPDAVWRLKEFCVSVLGEAEAAGQSISVLLEALKHREVFVVVKHIPTKDGKDQLAVVDDLVPIANAAG